MTTTISEGFRLETAVYIGIAVDVALAIIAGMLIYWWRKRRSDERNERKKISHYMVSQRESVRTDMTTMRMTSEDEDEGVPNTDQRQVNAVVPLQRTVTESKSGTSLEAVEGNFAFLNNHFRTQPENTEHAEKEDETADMKNSRRSHVTFTDINEEGDPQGEHFTTDSGERVVHNPLSGSVRQHASLIGIEDDQISPHNEDIALSTYYTYNPATHQLDGEETEETLSDGEASPRPPTPPPPPPEINLNEVEPETGSDVESPVTPPPPPSAYDSDGSGGMEPNPLYQAGSISDGKSDADGDADIDADPDYEELREDVKSTSTMNFGEEDVAKLYNTELDESTDIM